MRGGGALLCCNAECQPHLQQHATRQLQRPADALLCSAQLRSAHSSPITLHRGVGLRSCGAKRRTAMQAATASAGATEMQTAQPDVALNLAIDLRNVSIAVGSGQQRKQVLWDCHFAVAPGQLHMLLGANGCGKSTLLRVAGGLLQPDVGAVATAQPAGFVFQNPDHQVVLPTAGADVAFGLGSCDLPEADVQLVVDSCLALVGLAGFQRRSAHTLSGGERQRLAIAGALAQAPAVLLLDELTSFLDEGDQQSVLKAVRAAVDAGGVTAVWVTHRLDELAWADAASYMDGGSIAVSGSVDRVRQHLARLGARV